ncbi:CBS domain-containing protein [bacterium]|nr:MAG: CBS domain-containing protein [bacterium]
MAPVNPFRRPLAELADDDFLAVDEKTPYDEVLGRMRGSHAGSLVVTKGGKVTGVFTERDVLNRCALESVGGGTPVGTLMTPKPATLALTATVAEALTLMHGRRVRNIPLVDEKGAPKGLLTVGRLIRFLAYAFPAEVVNLPPRPGQVSDETEGA